MPHNSRSRLTVFATVTALSLGLAATTAAPASAKPAAPAAKSAAPAPVASVDLSRYLGSWYQVAAKPALYEIQCKKNSTARYALTATGSVSVTNSCSTWLGSSSTVKGDAKALDATNARLNVSFLGTGTSWLHTAQANYIVIGLADDYRWAVVTDSDRASGFVLSRTPALAPADTTAAQSALTRAGIDPCAIRYTPQDGGNTTTAPFCTR
ncbi:apolipoprotein D and lipocalin family protein [Kitasatospora sp. SolWspMP-SS2h]|uniref:lipocalin family protein n=1 Tax=Kitasatospora sp. SolWspMP-SS2h TaxID=1305729 RepID=UPI000DC01508|nr:lipocalin family protein [Kitasatospora sp. SolWspMP-SS2h]RAJ31270.1 apolipoprotein D and lipocalin family protein [Kitasatospora sp. SolWspMP-SS2h]